jgi:hypothetical protein
MIHLTPLQVKHELCMPELSGVRVRDVYMSVWDVYRSVGDVYMSVGDVRVRVKQELCMPDEGGVASVGSEERICAAL